MKAVDLRPGFRIQQSTGQTAIVIATNWAPDNPIFMQIIWAVEDRANLGPTVGRIAGTNYPEVYLTIDILDPRQEVGDYIGNATTDQYQSSLKGRIWRPSTS